MREPVAAEKNRSDKKKGRVLIVEDDTSLLFGLKKNLHFEGYEVLTASDGETGLRLAVDERPDLIVLDVMLPRMNGFEVCEVLRSNKVETPVIFLTAKALESDKVTGLTLGGDDYMTKPFSVAELLAIRNREHFDVRRLPGFTAIATFCLIALYLPLILVIFFSFNADRSVTVFSHFGLNWYEEAARNTLSLIHI